MRAVVLISVLALAAPVRPPRDPVPNEARPLAEQIQGEWQVIDAKVSGRPHRSVKPGEVVVWVFASNKKILRLPSNKEYTYEFTLDTTRQPAFIDSVLTKDGTMDRKGQPSMGIVKIEGDVLTICLNSAARPTEFISSADTKAALWQMKRVK
jgi:uncharacterized protein (TIGR03067 family)